MEDTDMPALDRDNPAPSQPSFPCRPAGLPRSNTFGEMSSQATQQAGNMSLQQGQTAQGEVAPGELERTANVGTITAVAVAISVLLVLTFTLLGFYICASLRRRPSSSSSNENSNSGTAAGNREHDIEMQVHAHAPQQGQQALEEGEGQRLRHEEQERWPLSEHDEEDGEEEEEEEGEGREAGPAETGTARVAHLVARGSVSMVDIRRRKPRSLPSSRTVRDISSLPDLAWAQSLTTGGGRSAMSMTSAGPISSVPVTKGGPDHAGKKETSSSSSGSSKKKGFRKMVGKNKVKEWCERGMGMGTGGFGPYAGMY